MDTIDRSVSNLPVPFPAASSQPSDLTPASSGDLATTPGLQIDSRIILRGLRRHWWHIIAVSLAVFLPVACLIWKFVEPTYEAFSILRVEPIPPTIFSSVHAAGGGSDPRSVGAYLETQVNLITSDRVLSVAIADPSVVNLRLIKESKDPKFDLRKKMTVEIVETAYLIRVALDLADKHQAATIVDAVVQSYLTYNAEYMRSANSTLKATLNEVRKRIQDEIQEKKAKLAELLKKGTVDLPQPKLASRDSKNDGDGAQQPTMSNLTEGHVQRLVDKVVSTDLELIEAQANLEVMEAASRANAEENAQLSPKDDAAIEDRIKEEFLKDPAVVALIGELSDAKEQLEHAKARAVLPNDPARLATVRQHKKLTEEYTALWASKHDEIRKVLLKPLTGTSQLPETISSLKIRVAALKKRQEEQAKLFERSKAEKKEGNNDTFEATFLNHEVSALLAHEENINSHLQQLEFDAGQEVFRVVLVDKASVPQTPTNNKMLKYMAAAPVGILFMVLGLFLLLEIKAERVDDPDALSTRIRSQVYALPPLPTTRSMRKLSAPEADDQIEQFIQRLDHLRFGVCGKPAELGKGRCVLITSAVGGEGKTTLAAQLAARCGNAGMSTLLIDADLRRTALCPLLDVPEGPGLSDVLKDEATIEEVVIPVQGGTFYLLPAGTPIKDTSRVLQSHNFGSLITQLRQRYDLVIIDSPPVLPVPDALILGRWADGAVLAARYDISRFPQVERARRQLDNAGIAILGTVINGMRHSESYYGRYSYSRQRSSQPNSSNAI